MGGSRKWFKYTCDNGDVFGVNMDESNGEAISNTDFGPLDDGAIIYSLPGNVKPREAVYRTLDGLRSARIVVTDANDNLSTLPGTINLATGELANLTQFSGEVVRPVPVSWDTGIDDGDAD